MTLAESYSPALRNFMTYRNARNYPSGHCFSREELEPITADELYRWTKHRVYGNEAVDEGTVPPVHYRASTVLSWKRAISYYMVNNNMAWNETAQMGNPTRSHQMARLVKHMKRFQTQRRGVAPQARRPMTNGEFEKIQEHYWTLSNRELGLLRAAASTFQLSMIARVDDTAKFREADLAAYPLFPEFGVIAKLPWSKNVFDERDAPPQVCLVPWTLAMMSSQI
jgi:hypothetical protein